MPGKPGLGDLCFGTSGKDGTMFMEPQIVEGSWVTVEDDHGEMYRIPAEYAGDALVHPQGFAVVDEMDGFGARLSAPGYLDCTEWDVFLTKEHARAHLREMYGDDDQEMLDAIDAL